MLERIRSQPWMAATIVLAVALVVSLAMLFTRSPSGESGDDATATSTTTSPSGASTTDPSEESPVGGELLSVVVDNAAPAQPQVGIAEAAVLVEYPVEGGITRFNALLHSGATGLIGPVRSLRPVNTPLLSALTTAVVSSGGQPFVLQELTAAGITSITPDAATPTFVSLGRPSPHDTFLDLDLLAEMFTVATPAPGLPSDGVLPGARGPGTEIDLPFAGVSYAYEEGQGYLRLQDGAPFQVLDPTGSDLVDVRHDVLVVLSAAERSAGYEDSNGVPVSTFDVIGSGDLQVLSGGEVVRGTWFRAALVDPFEFVDESGQPFELPDGQVYLAIVPRDSAVEVR